MNILIVDDNPVDLKVMRMQLEGESHEVIQAGDGTEALELLNDHRRVDVVISDILMPNMDGFQLCHEIRKHDQLHGLPTIVYSSTFISPDDVKLALDAGADRYLRKPASLESITTALREVIARPCAATNVAALPEEAGGLKKYSQQLVDKLAEKKNALELANRELSTIRNRLTHLLEHYPVVFYSLKVEGGQVISQLVSENVQKVLGFTAEESCSFNWLMEHVHPEDCEHVVAGILEVVKCGTWNGEYRIQHQAGHFIWVEDNQRLVRNAGSTSAEIIGVWTDITGRKQTESNLLRAQRLESIGAMACGVAHDLNNVLAPILITTELVRMDFPGMAVESLDLIEASAQRGAGMVKHLLTFVKGTEGARVLVHTQPLLEEMKRMIELSFPREIKLRMSFAPDLRPILGDATQLEQVLLNLCVNARDAMPDGGTITLKAENIELDVASACTIAGAKPGPYVAWNVADTGMGMSPEVRKRIFEPFFTTKGPEKGTGLGLSTLRDIVRSHGGFVQVLSVVGRGSMFTVYLPVADPGETKTWLEKNKCPFRGHGETVLVVDDETGLRDCMRKMLAGLNFKVLTASDGTTALAQILENRTEPRLVITDFQMPGMDGLTFTRAIKAKLPRAGIIVVSSLAEKRMSAGFDQLGVNALLEKPFSQEQFVAALKKVFQQ